MKAHKTFAALVAVFIGLPGFAAAVVYLQQAKVIDVVKPAAGALDDSFARKAAHVAKAPLPLGIIKAQDVSRMPK